MKLLLTSAGISNKSIEDALQSLSEKPLKELKVAFVPTASNWIDDEKEWLINDLMRCQKIFGEVDIVDISALPREKWEARFEKADVFFFEGGYTFHLMRWIEKSGLQEILPKLVEEKIYIGASAGSMVTTPSLFLEDSKVLYDEDPEDWEKDEALGLVDFCIMPHYNSDDFPKVNDENLKEIAKKTSQSIYALDDESAIKILDGEMEVISEGEWKKF
ncbi:MAG: Type 1 glutamine amidotransferase-like domain-containing protein [Candidatus Moranbacteria bacterium]|nr:Type 1 glutamine amidotransferase-like domain-containing protein [Candidatus Moranbacteria bacterium]